MKRIPGRIARLTLCLALLAGSASLAHADGNLNNLQHIIVVMMENHSFDNYFGALPYVPGTPYHSGPCSATDHVCVDGLSCQRNPANGKYVCHNSNRDVDGHGKKVFAFHSADYCVATDLDHSWLGVHLEDNFLSPNLGLLSSPLDGFVSQNDSTSQPDNGMESRADDETMSFYNEQDIGFYYALAQTFAIGDRYFSAVLGPTFPNRSYLMAATSFGHLTTNESVPDITKSPVLVYEPIAGTIFDLLDRGGISWTDYSDDVPQGVSFRNFLTDPTHFRSYSGKGLLGGIPNDFLRDAAAGTLPAVSFLDPNFGFILPENDEHPGPGPGGDIRAGQSFVAQALAAIRNGPDWSTSAIFVTYDEHGGFYDHVAPPAPSQGGALNPDGIDPGQCADLSNPPASQQPSGGLNCLESNADAVSLCAGFTPTGPFPSSCANFDQFGVRVPMMAVSPFAKPHYVSHASGDHTALLALIEKRFLSTGGSVQHLTARDADSGTLEDLFDFDNSPSLTTPLPPAPPAASPNDPGCTPPGA